MNSKKEKVEYNLIITDTFNGEANFAWSRKLTVIANSPIQAMRKGLRQEGYKPPSSAKFICCKASLIFTLALTILINSSSLTLYAVMHVYIACCK